MELPTKPGAVIRWKFRYDGAYQYRVVVLSIHPVYEYGLAWHHSGFRYPLSPEKMQKLVDTDWGVWEILHEGEE